MKWTNETLTEDLVVASTEKNLKALKPHIPEMVALLHEAERIPKMPMAQGRKVIRLYEIRDRLTSLVQPITPCKSGCSHCCKMAVGISDGEADTISKHIGVPAQKIKSIEDPLVAIKKHMGSPCPFLKKGQCSIYEVRPGACRTHFNLSDYPDICDVLRLPGRSVPNFDWNQYWISAASVVFEAGAAFGDIRDYFPEGANHVQSL